MSDVAELKKLGKELQSAPSAKEILDILRVLKEKFKVTESLLRESKVGLAVGKLRANPSKEVSDLAKELVKKWKNEVDRAKAANGGGTAKASTPTATTKVALRRASVAESIGTPPPKTPTTPTLGSQDVARSAKLDGVKVNATGDKTRDKCIELIYDSLSIGSTAPNDQILRKAQAIEQQVITDFDNVMGKEYKDKMRSLFLNLKDKGNPGLRQGVVDGDIPVPKLCKMSPQDMASEERKAENKAIQAQNLHNSLGAADQQAETEAFQCSRCKNWKTRYYQAQTRSADEPMTTFVTCTVCNNRWKFS
ncbi:transcription elongation factor [Schizopora paradoxa]|uniref:Transcription elongation factor n=1 Tax=Schizopora paradoxa TaxID=27342 RepID=A0A0H2R8L6_9AGAM|nr:transcription elongation factor [Schizopora paradoxa]